jgi:SPP1 gp7 family putative phage head morphogenesis protein
MGAVDELIADALIAQGVDLIRLEGGYNRAALRLLKDMERELVEKLADREITSYSRQRLLDFLAEARSVIARTYVAMRAEVDLQGVAQVQAGAVGGAIQGVIGDRLTVAVPAVQTMRSLVSDLLIQGAPSADWWSRQAGDTQFRFANAIRQGIAQGETNAQIVARIRKGSGAMGPIVETSRRNAEALVRTSVQTVANATRLEVFKANDSVLAGVRQISTLDGRTSDTCIAYSGAEWDTDGNPINGTKLPFNGGPPRHWNCRSVLTPIVKPLPGLPEFRPSERASADGPVRADVTFAEWLAGKSKGFQDDLLGSGRAQLWRDDKITLQQLLDQRGRPLTLEQLRAKYAA